MRPLALAAPALVLGLLPAVARADEPPSADLRGLYAPLHHEAGLTMEPSRSPDTGDLTAVARLSYAFRPVVLRDASGEIAHRVVEHQVVSDMGLSIGVLGLLTLGFDLPVLLAQSGDDLRLAPDALRVVGDQPPSRAALGDPAVRLKLSFVRPDLDEQGLQDGFGLAVDERFTVPLGDERSFLAEGTVSNELRVLVDYGFGAVTAHARAGLKIRGDVGRYACNPEAPEDTCLSRFGHELPLGAGVAIHPRALGIDPEGRGTLFLETRGWLPLAPIAPFESSLPAGWFASVAGRLRVHEDIAVFAAVEVALNDGVGNAPFRGTLGLSLAPRAPDRDRDGQPDDVDRCPGFAEDVDGFEDGDGCPEMDNDADGVPDEVDACPTRPGRGADASGCPS